MKEIKARYSPINKDRWVDEYFISRFSNDPKRIEQFQLDEAYIKRYVKKGALCDVGCSTGEFVRNINWDGEKYGMEISDFAKEKASDIISFDKNIFTEKDFFDVIIFRGTIQHVDEPFRMIKKSFTSLKSGGHLIFIATPNANSLVYKLKGNLGFLDSKLNYYIPGDKELTNALINFGFEILSIEYPYIETPYCNLLTDHFKFLFNLFTPSFYPHSFWKNMMNIAARKL